MNLRGSLSYRNVYTQEQHYQAITVFTTHFLHCIGSDGKSTNSKKKKKCMASILRTLTVAKKQFFACKSQFLPSRSLLHAIHYVCSWFVHDVNICMFVIPVVTSSGSDGEDSDSFTGFSQHAEWGWRHRISHCLLSCCYVFSNDGTSCMVTAVDPLLVLNCSMWFSSTLLSSTLGSWKLSSEAGFELAMLPDTELIPMVLSGMLPWTVDCDNFWRGLEPPLAPRTLDTCVRLGNETE